jgi:uncharacterized FAD-dependent dehydrogenase
LREIQISTPAEYGFDENKLKKFLIEKGLMSFNETVFILKRSIDARSREIKTHLKLKISELSNSPEVIFEPNYQAVHQQMEIIIVGSGPAGLFAALKCLQLGIKPIILERGKEIRERRRDLAKLNKNGIVNPESNYCFGEGGAGTFSDGKLYTRSNKRGEVSEILNLLVYHGASPEILIDAHPHIGTNKLPQVIENIRKTIIEKGGEIFFNTKVTDLIIENQTIKGVISSKSEKFYGKAVILATGHSARDIYELLDRKKILMETKPFAMGIRIEHPQFLIDQMQYHCKVRPEYLPPASYSWVESIQGRGVYSFCMCPGGIIAPCASQENEVVTNGWSPSRRNNPFSNSGIVVEIQPEDIPKEFKKYGVFSLLEFQKFIEKQAFLAGGGFLKAPAQRMIDFIQNKNSIDLPKCSYFPGLTASNLKNWLPFIITDKLSKAFLKLKNKMKPYFTNEAVLVGVETRTSTPVRIPRNPVTCEHLEIENLYPCGEGAGYAGGIVSAAIDGQKIVQKIKNKWA